MLRAFVAVLAIPAPTPANEDTLLMFELEGRVVMLVRRVFCAGRSVKRGEARCAAKSSRSWP